MAHCKANQLDMHGFCNRFDAPCIKKNCRFFGVKTNADRIRAMSDEELAEMLGWKCLCEYIPVHASEHCEKYKRCKDCLVEWLKQPADMRGEEE